MSQALKDARAEAQQKGLELYRALKGWRPSSMRHEKNVLDASLLNWLDKHPECELSYSGWDEEPQWEVHRVIGNRNDREWKLIGSGETVRLAIVDAMEKK
jgi:hypothetical protein